MSRSSFEIHVTAPFDFQQCLLFLRRSNDEVMHVARETSVSKLFDVEGRLLLGDIMETAHGLVIAFSEDDITSSEQKHVERYVRDWFDLDQDVVAFVRMAETDELLRPLVREYEGLRLIGFPDLFEALAWAVIGQQITLSFAYTLKRRFVEQYGPSREVDGVTYWAFPTPETIALLDPSELRQLQFSTRKAEYIIGIAQEMTDGRLSKQQLRNEPPDVIHERLVVKLTRCRGVDGRVCPDEVFPRSDGVPGCGRWSASGVEASSWAKRQVDGRRSEALRGTLCRMGSVRHILFMEVIVWRRIDWTM